MVHWNSLSQEVSVPVTWSVVGTTQFLLVAFLLEHEKIDIQQDVLPFGQRVAAPQTLSRAGEPVKRSWPADHVSATHAFDLLIQRLLLFFIIFPKT